MGGWGRGLRNRKRLEMRGRKGRKGRKGKRLVVDDVLVLAVRYGGN
jgi:hypothetical protein